MANNDVLSIQKELKELLLSKGVSDIGFSYLGNADSGELQNGISIVVKLSDAIIDEIDEEPTPTYFNHYRTVNAFIDRCLLEAGLFLESNGYKYITIAASQSMPGTPYNGRYSHKEAARKAAEKEEAAREKRMKSAVKKVASSATGTIGREIGNTIGSSIGGKFGKRLGGNVGASLGRGILSTLFKF